MNTQVALTDDDGAAVIQLDDVVLDLKVRRLIQLDADIKAAKEARDDLADELIEVIGDGSVLTGGIKVTVVRPVRRVIDIVKLEAVASRRLFAKLTKRVVSISDYDAHLQAGTTGIEAVAEIVEEVDVKPSLRITK